MLEREVLRVTLTDARIRALKPAASRYPVLDAVVPGLVVRVSPNGFKAFALRPKKRPQKNAWSARTQSCANVSDTSKD